MANSQITRFDFTWMAAFPLIMIIANYSTLIWEIYFPVSVWNPRLRLPVLVFGTLFHLGIALVINITFFSALMITTYIFFLQKKEVDALYYWVSSKVGALHRKVKVPPRTADQFFV